MLKMTSEQRQTIYGMATQLGIYEKGNSNDNLHLLVKRLTGKDSIGKLDKAAAAEVISELIHLKNGFLPKRQTNLKKMQPEQRPGMILPEQAKKVWYFMYRLQGLDSEPSKVSLGYRLCSIIEKNLNVSAFEKDPFRFVTFDQGSILIEVVKKLVQYEERKVKKSNRNA
jgi:hypothetical protein